MVWASLAKYSIFELGCDVPRTYTEELIKHMDGKQLKQLYYIT